MITKIRDLFARHLPRNKRTCLRRASKQVRAAGHPPEALEDRVLLSVINGVVVLDRDADQTVSDEGQTAGLDGISVSLVSLGNDQSFGTIDDRIIRRSTTDMLGKFSFSNVNAGMYVLTVENMSQTTLHGEGSVNFTHTGNGTYVSSSLTIGASGTTTINLGLKPVGDLDHRLFVLDRTLELSYPSSKGLVNWGGRNEIWFQGDYNSAGNRWYFLTPDGAFHSWDGTSKAKGPFVAQLSSSTYRNPSTLNSAKPKVATASNLQETAFLLRHLLHLQPAAKDFTNSGGTNEKWLLGDKNSFGNRWYFIRPDGKFYEWNGVARSAAGNLIANLSPAHYVEMQLLYSALNPSAKSAQEKAVAVAQELWLQQSSNFATNWGGQGEKWLQGKVNQFGNPWYYLLPNGELYSWDGKGRVLSGQLLHRVDRSIFANPNLLFNTGIAERINSSNWSTLAADQQYGLKYTGKSFAGYAGSTSQWLFGTRHEFGNSWYVLTSSGDVLQWNGRPGSPTGKRVTNIGSPTGRSLASIASAVPSFESLAFVPEDLSTRLVATPLRILPGEAGQFIDITTKLSSGKATFQEIGFFVMDDADGRVNGVLPGSAGYASEVMAQSSRQVLYVYGDGVRTQDAHRLPASRGIGIYAIGMPGSKMQTAKDHLQIVSTGARSSRVEWEEQTSVWPGLGSPRFDDAAVDLQYSDPVDPKDEDCTFDDGLTTWTVKETGGSSTGRGTVKAQNCIATLVEGDSFTTTLATSFTVPVNATSISFTYSNLRFDTNDPSFINDAFEVALVDKDGDSLVPAYAASRDAFFNVTEGLNATVGSGVSLFGSTVTLDVSGVLPGTVATLIFRLTNNDSDVTTTVELVDITGVSQNTKVDDVSNAVPGDLTRILEDRIQNLGAPSAGIGTHSRGVSSAQTVVEGGLVNSGNGSPTRVTDPNDPRVWQGASVGTFARLLYGDDTLVNRQRIIDEQILDAGIFDITAAHPASLLPTAWTTAGPGVGFSHDLTGTGSYSYGGGGADVFGAANVIDNYWFQSSGTIGDTVFDLGAPSSKAAVFNTIDHGPLPGEAIESTVYLSNDRVKWTQAIVERVWLEGFQKNAGILWDGFVYAVGTGTGETFQYVSVIHGGPGALLSDGDNEINGILGLDEFYQPTTRPSLKIAASAPDSEFRAGESVVISGIAELISQSSFAEFGTIEAVFVNGRPVDVLDPTGTFFAQFGVALGDNRIEVSALDSFGRTASAELLLIGISERSGDIELGRMNDVSAAFAGVYGRTSFDASSRQLYVDLATRNDGAFVSDIPLLVGVRNISDPLVTVVDADGYLPDGTPYFDFTQYVTGGKLAPGQISGSPTISFLNPTRGQFDYELVFLGRLNDPPEIITVPKIEAIAGKAYTYDVDAIDRDSDNLIYSLTQAPEGMLIDSSNGQITWATSGSNVGMHNIQVQVSDGRGGKATQLYSLSVTAGPPNRPPIITSTAPIDATGIAYISTEPISYESEWLYKVVNFDELPGFEQPSFDASAFAAGVGGFGSGGNCILNQTARKTYWPVGTDILLRRTIVLPNGGKGMVIQGAIDNDVQVFVNGVDVSQGLRTNEGCAERNEFRIEVPDRLLELGDNVIAVRARDRGAEAYVDLVVTVERPASSNSSAASGGYLYCYDVSAIDPDQDLLNFRLGPGAPSGMAIDSATGVIRWSPTDKQIGMHTVDVFADDGRGGVAQQKFTVCVHPVEGNHAPIIVSEPLTTTKPGAAFSTTIRAVDPDQDSLAYSLLAGPGGMAIDSVTGVLTWAVPSTFATGVSVSVEARDGKGGRTQQDFTLTPPSGQGEIRGSVYNTSSSPGNLVRNGAFESGAVDFRTDLVDGFPGSSGTYRVGTDPFLVYGGINPNVASFGDHTTGNGKMLMVNGSENPGFVNWEQVVDVTPNTEYFFSTWAATFFDVAPARLQFAINGVVVGNTLRLPAVEGQWQQFAASWNSGNSTSAKLQIRNDTTAFFGNDFVVDDIVFHPVSQLKSWIVYIDQNGNRVRDIGELSTVTDTNGDYAFTGLGAGTYVVREESRFDWQQTFPSQSLPGDGSHVVTISSSEVATGIDFSNVFRGDPQDSRPSFNSTPITKATPQQLYRYDAIASDPNDDPVTYRLVTGPEGMTVHPQLGSLVWMPSAEQAGSYSIVLEASDGSGGLAVQSFTLAVGNLNHAPIITSTPPVTATAGQAWSYLLEAQDADADVIEFSLENPPAGMTIVATPILNAEGTAIEVEHRVTWQVPTNAAGVTPAITVIARDGKGGVDRQTWSLTIRPAGTSNSSPAFTSTPRPTARVGLVWSYRVTTVDVDGDPVTLSLAQKPNGMALSPSGVLTWMPAENDPRSATVRIVATDSRGASTIQEFTINVAASGANNIPVVTSNPRLRAIEGVDYAYNAVAEDADGDELLWILEDAPRGMSINARTGQIRWTPDHEQQGSHGVSLKVVDAFQGESFQSFQIDVVCTNSAPAILSVPPTIAISERTYLYAVRADDRDGDALSWRLASAPAGMTIDPKTGIIRWIPTAAQLTSHNVVVEATDGLNVGTQAYSVVVYSSQSLIDPSDPSKGTRGNRAPIINSNPVYSAEVDKVYNYSVSAVDPDGDSVTLSLIGTVPQGLAMNAAGLISWTPEAAAVGEHSITVQARDTNGGVANQSYLLKVAQNRVPVISSNAATSVTRGATYRYSVRATDPDGDTLSYRLDQAPEGMSVDRFGRIIWQTDAAHTSSQNVRLVVSDGRGGTATQEWTITPADDTEKPVVSIVITSGGQTYYGNATFNQNAVYRVIVSATDNVGVTDLRLLVNGTLTTLDQNQSVTLSGRDLGNTQLRAVAFDAAGLNGTYDATVSIVDPAQPNRPVPTDPTLPPHPGFKPSDAGRPVVQITSPAISATVTNRTPIIGTVDDPENNLWYYRVYTSRVDRVSITEFDLKDPDWAILNTSTQEVVNGQLGIFDASSLGNDPYVIAVAAYDVNGAGWIEAVLVNVEGNVLVGNFHLELTDLTIPLAGIPIQVNRVYDTINADIIGDFGYGWSLGVQDGRILEVGAIGDGGAFNSGSDYFVPGRTKVYLTNPAGKRVGFTYQEKLISYSFFGGVWAPYFVPDPGVYDTLTIDETQVARGGIIGALSQGINPDFYTLTTKEGLSYRYSDTAGLQTITDRNANKVTFTEDGVFHSDGQSIRFLRDSKGRIKSIVDPSGNAIKYEYDLKGDLVKVTNQAGLSTGYVYLSSPAHFLDEAYDALNNRVLKAVYDEKNKFVGLFDALGNRVDRRDFDTANNTGVIRDARGNATIVVYDNRGNVLRETDPQGNATTREYNDPQNPDLETRIIDRNGNVTTRAYDARGNVTQIAELGSLSNPLPSPVLTMMTYDIFNNVTSITNANAASTHFTHDETGNLTTIVNALGDASYITYDTQGRRSSVTDFNGNKTTFWYDDACPCGAPHKVIYADGTYQVFDYNQYGNATLEQWFEADGTLVQQKRTEYDTTGRVTREILGGGNDPKHPATEVRKFYTGDLLDWEVIVNPLSLNPDGSLRESPSTPVANRKSRITDYNYDTNSRLVQQIDAMGGIVEFRYDADGNRVLLQDPLGNITTWAYDKLNRVAEERDPFYNQTFTIDQAITALNVPSGASLAANQGAAHVRSFGYDAEGNQSEIIDRNNRRREFRYDYSGHLLEERWYAANNGVLVETISFTYDSLGNMLTAINGNSHYVYTYDTLNRLASVDNLDSNLDTPRVILYYSYDAQGNVIRTADNAGVTVDSTYNARNLLETRRWYDDIVPAGQPADVADASVNFIYNAAGRQKQIRRYSDLNSSTKVGTSDYTYDTAGRTDTVIHKDAIDTLFSGYSYDYDFTGLPVGEQRDHRNSQYDQTITYDYDLTGQLIDAMFSGQNDERYAYDLNGNRETSSDGSGNRSYTIDTANQMIFDGTHEFIYDEEGNQKLKIRVSDNAVSENFWDHKNQLVKVEDRSADGVLLRTVEYSYDAHGRRTSERVNGSVTLRSVLNGDNAWADYDAAGIGVSHYLFTNNTDQIVSAFRVDAGTVWYYADSVGTVRDLSSASGLIGDPITYGVFGVILSGMDGKEWNRYSFTGREWHGDVSGYYFRARFYTADTGRFASNDPLSFRAGDSNLFRYALNTPTMFTDPSGLMVLEASFATVPAMMSVAAVSLLGAALVTELWAINAYQQAAGLIGAHNGPGDAVRHCVWMAGTASTIGASLALQFGELNERIHPGPADELVMDRNNNAVGARIGVRLGAFGDFRSACIAELPNLGLGLGGSAGGGFGPGGSLIVLPRARWGGVGQPYY